MIDPRDRQRLAENWLRVVHDVEQAASQSSRNLSEVRIVGVTKYVNADMTEALVDVGCRDLGENRPQSLWEKAEKLGGRDLCWHQIGHLQRNKIRRTLQYPVVIHSVDSVRLLDAIDDEQRLANDTRAVDVLLEVNISGEEAKTGMSPNELRDVMPSLPRDRVNVRGLMAMAGWGTAGDEARRQFAAVREFRDSLASEFGLPLDELSMGMSGDFAEAIAEGATMVRIGSRIFDGLLAT